MSWRTLVWAGQGKLAGAPQWAEAERDNVNGRDVLMRHSKTTAGSVYTDFINNVVGEQFY